MGNNLTTLARVAGVVLLSAVAVGCAGDKGEIDRVQPGYVKKADLLTGSWYYRRTVVDAPETMAPYATIGTGDLFTIERVRFEVQEHWLLAYRDYEYVLGSETASQEDADYFGSPIAAFPITEQFDIEYGYNPETGEKNNVREENTTDRHWYEREYMRVDWSKNGNPSIDLILPVDLLDVDNTNGGAHYVYEDEATNPYHARIEPENGYLDFVVNHYAVSDPETCYLNFDFQMNPYICGPGEIRVRHAFMKVDTTRESNYQPLYYPDSIALKDGTGHEVTDPATGEVKREPIYERFGFYRLERAYYDKLRDLTDSGVVRRALRFDIWDRSLDAQGNVIPYAQRNVRPIEYYLNADFPDDLKDSAREVADQWNQIFQNMVATLQQKDVSQVPDVFILRENTCNKAGVTAYLSSHSDVKDAVVADMGEGLSSASLDAKLMNWCSATEYQSRYDADGNARKDRFVWQQNGDPRFNMMYWIPNIVPAAFSGYGPMLGDPVSGRIVESSAYVLGWTIDDAVTRALEYIDYINGELSIDELLQGSNLPYDPALFGPPKASQNLTVDMAQARAKALPSPEFVDSVEQRLQGLGGTPAELLTKIDNGSHFAERLSRIRGTPLEAQWLTRPEDLMVASEGQWKPGMPVSDDLLKEASFATSMREHHFKNDRAQRLFQEHTFCPMVDLDGALAGLAKKLKGVPHDEARETLRRAIFKAVMLHEVGHNLGLRHNFEGSYDALNFNDAFWDIETAGLSEEDKLLAQQPEYKYSSIMDYHGKINADFQGLGKYDNAAIKFGYGQLIETFADAQPIAGHALKGWRLLNDYTKLPGQLGGVSAMRSRKDVIFDWNKPDLTIDEVSAITANEVPYMYCSDEYAGYTPTCKRFDFGANQREVAEANRIRYKNYRIFSNFLRNRLTINWAAADRGYTAFHDALLTYQYWYLYRATNPDFKNTDLYSDMLKAYVDGFNLMAEVLATPEPGTYFPCSYDGGATSVYYSYDLGDYSDAIYKGATCDYANQVFIPLGDAFPLFLGFSEDFTAWTFTYIGTYWDKEAAVAELTDPQAYFFRVNQVEDARLYSISPFRVFDREILNLMNNVIRYDLPNLASYLPAAAGDFTNVDGVKLANKPLVGHTLIDPDQALQDLPSTTTAPANTIPVYPAMARNLQRLGVLYGIAFLTSPLDATLDFSKHTRIFLKGAYDDLPSWNTTTLDKAECMIPSSGYTYRAVATDDGYSIGVDMVNECSRLVKKVYDFEHIAELQAPGHPPLTPEEQEDVDLVTANPDMADSYLSEARFDLDVSVQTLQWSRLIHLVYEHGADL